MYIYIYIGIEREIYKHMFVHKTFLSRASGKAPPSPKSARLRGTKPLRLPARKGVAWLSLLLYRICMYVYVYVHIYIYMYIITCCECLFDYL